MDKKDRYQATVFLNSLQTSESFIYFNSSGSIGTSSRIMVASKNIINEGVPLTTAYIEKVKEYYNKASIRRRREIQEDYDAIIAYQNIDDNYYDVNQDRYMSIPAVQEYVDTYFASQETGPYVQAQAEEESEEETLPTTQAQVETAALQDEDKEELSPYENYKDDLDQVLIEKNYNETRKSLIHIYFKRVDDKDKMLRFIERAKASALPITSDSMIMEPVEPAEHTEVTEAIVQDPATSVINSATDSEYTWDASTNNDSIEENPPEEKASITQGNDKLVYIKRYHETSLTLYFQNSSHPSWDTVLEANIMSLKISKEEIKEMMNDIIKEFGTKLFITSSKSDTLEELNELVQLQFCILRNLHIGNRSRTAQVKLSDLQNLQAAAAGASGSQVDANGNISNVPIQSNISEVPNVQSAKEFNFIRDYDKLLTLVNLKKDKDNVTNNQRDKLPKSYQPDPHTLGIIPGNNLQSVKDMVPRRVLKSNKYVS